MLMYMPGTTDLVINTNNIIAIESTPNSGEWKSEMLMVDGSKIHFIQTVKEVLNHINSKEDRS